MFIKKFHSVETQECRLGNNIWSVARLHQLAKDLEVMLVPLDHLNVFYIYDKLTLREMVMHFNTVNNADLSYPIILDEDGDIMDGRHRVMKAIMVGEKNIKAVRFQENPQPCKVIE
jgi:hypothetical protein